MLFIIREIYIEIKLQSYLKKYQKRIFKLSIKDKTDARGGDAQEELYQSRIGELLKLACVGFQIKGNSSQARV
jgi:hypothetical protein